MIETINELCTYKLYQKTQQLIEIVKFSKFEVPTYLNTKKFHSRNLDEKKKKKTL